MIHENKDQLIDIYGMWYQPFWSTTWFDHLVIVFLSAVIGYVLWYFYKKYIYTKVVVDCATVALQDLDNLNKFPIVTQADSKDCYFRLSLIIKRYLTARYHIEFLQLTDAEIIAQSHLVMHEEQQLVLQKILQAMTLLKFEHQVAHGEQLEKDIQAVMQFIHSTTPQLATKEN